MNNVCLKIWKVADGIYFAWPKHVTAVASSKQQQREISQAYDATILSYGITNKYVYKVFILFQFLTCI